MTLPDGSIDACPRCGGPAYHYATGRVEALTDSEADAERARLRAALTAAEARAGAAEEVLHRIYLFANHYARCEAKDEPGDCDINHAEWREIAGWAAGVLRERDSASARRTAQRGFASLASD